MCMWVDLVVLWRRCNVICTVYKRRQEVMREWLLNENRQTKGENV